MARQGRNYQRPLHVLVVFLAAAGQVSSDEFIHIEREKASVQVRSEIVGYVYRGSELKVLSRNNEWVWIQIPDSDVKGWVDSSAGVVIRKANEKFTVLGDAVAKRTILIIDEDRVRRVCYAGTVAKIVAIDRAMLRLRDPYGGWVPADDFSPVDEASEYFSSALEKHPDDSQLHCARGTFYWCLAAANGAGRIGASEPLAWDFSREGREYLDAAISDLDTSLKLNPRHSIAHVIRGNTWKTLGNADEALKSYQQAVRYFPGYNEPHYQMGLIHWHLGDYPKAIDRFTDAIRVNPMLCWGALDGRLKAYEEYADQFRKAGDDEKYRYYLKLHFADEEAMRLKRRRSQLSPAVARREFFGDGEPRRTDRLTTEDGGKSRFSFPRGESELITNSIGMKLKLIPAGEFQMGSPSGEKGRDFDEHQHRVRISQSFYLQTTEVTQGQWETVMSTRPWSGRSYVKEGSDYPATYVSWEDAAEFCRRLSEKENVPYRLPSEAEWEYACRAGSRTAYSFGDNPTALGNSAWFDGNAWKANEKYAHRVGLKRPNEFGLYDMHGNVVEWCSDWYDKDYYKSSPDSDPPGPGSGSGRVYRGGSWSDYQNHCRSAKRNMFAPSNRGGGVGFRVVRSRREGK